jgi:hypothetical protein
MLQGELAAGANAEIASIDRVLLPCSLRVDLLA